MMHSSRMRTARMLTLSGREGGLSPGWGVSAYWPGGGSACPMALWEGRPPYGWTNMSKNITFPQLRLRAVIKIIVNPLAGLASVYTSFINRVSL